MRLYVILTLLLYSFPAFSRTLECSSLSDKLRECGDFVCSSEDSSRGGEIVTVKVANKGKYCEYQEITSNEHYKCDLNLEQRRFIADFYESESFKNKGPDAASEMDSVTLNKYMEIFSKKCKNMHKTSNNKVEYNDGSFSLDNNVFEDTVGEELNKVSIKRTEITSTDQHQGSGELDKLVEGYVEEIFSDNKKADELVSAYMEDMISNSGDINNNGMFMWGRSIFFKGDNINTLRDVIYKYDNGIPLVEFVEEEAVQEVEVIVEEPINIPDIHLNSLLYVGKGKWSAWVNGKIYKEGGDGIIIEDVDTNSIQFSVMINQSNVNDILSKYPGRFRDKKGVYRDASDAIMIDPDAGRLYVRLFPRQNFEYSGMIVQETDDIYKVNKGLIDKGKSISGDDAPYTYNSRSSTSSSSDSNNPQSWGWGGGGNANPEAVKDLSYDVEIDEGSIDYYPGDSW